MSVFIGKYLNKVQGKKRVLNITSEDLKAKTIAGTFNTTIDGQRYKFDVKGIIVEWQDTQSRWLFSLNGSGTIPNSKGTSPAFLSAVQSINGYSSTTARSAPLETLTVVVSWSEDINGFGEQTGSWEIALNRVSDDESEDDE